MKALEAESGHLVDTQTVAEFRERVLQGDWERVEALVPTLGVDTEDRLQVLCWDLMLDVALK